MLSPVSCTCLTPGQNSVSRQHGIRTITFWLSTAKTEVSVIFAIYNTINWQCARPLSKYRLSICRRRQNAPWKCRLHGPVTFSGISYFHFQHLFQTIGTILISLYYLVPLFWVLLYFISTGDTSGDIVATYRPDYVDIHLCISVVLKWIKTVTKKPDEAHDAQYWFVSRQFEPPL